MRTNNEPKARERRRSGEEAMANQVSEMLHTAQRLLYQISGSPYRPRPDVRFDLLVRDAKCWTCDRASYGDLETEDRLKARVRVWSVGSACA
jgi:hypothetical protein